MCPSPDSVDLLTKLVGFDTTNRSSNLGLIRLIHGVCGLEAHSSLTHLGANAIEAAARIIVFASTVADRLKDRDELESGFNPP